MSQRIVLVGPTLPFRGGISHYNTSLFRALRTNGWSQTCYSFSRQYPQWLYPGQSDLDPAYSEHRENGVVYAIDSVNPLTWRRTARQIAASAPDLVVFHWWTVFWLPCFQAMMWLLRRRGIRSALICHNLMDHDAGRAKQMLSQHLLSQADAHLVHTNEHAQALRTLFPDKPVVQHPHPVYDHYPAARGTLSQRGKLELLFFGFIRPYKGLDLLIEALAALNDESIFLTVVGEPWDDEKEIARLAERAPNVELHLSYISDEQAAEYFARADLVVLPYRTATGSGVASLAIGYEKPLLVTRVGALPEVVAEGVNGYVIPPNDVPALIKAIAGTDRTRLQDLAQGVHRIRADMSWDSLSASLIQLAEAMRQP